MANKNTSDKLYDPSIEIPHSEEFAAVESIGSTLTLTHSSRGKVKTKKINLDNTDEINDVVKTEVQNIFDNKHKIIATSFNEKESYKKLAPKLWLDEDIVSFVATDEKTGDSIKVVNLIKNRLQCVS